MNACSIYEQPVILKMNFNFNFKDMLGAAGASIGCITNVRDLHHTAESGD